MRAELANLNHCAVPLLSRAVVNLSWYDNIYFSQKQLPRKMKSRLVIIDCAGYNFWQLFCGECMYYLRSN